MIGRVVGGIDVRRGIAIAIDEFDPNGGLIMDYDDGAHKIDPGAC